MAAFYLADFCFLALIRVIPVLCLLRTKVYTHSSHQTHNCIGIYIQYTSYYPEVKKPQKKLKRTVFLFLQH